MAKSELSPTYEEVVAKKAALDADVPGPKPDIPYTVKDAAYGDPGHVNPAIEPAPAWVPKDRPPPVPVINDPGLLGAPPTLQELNAAAFGESKEPGVTEEENRAEIRDAAIARMKALKEAGADASARSRRSVQASSK